MTHPLIQHLQNPALFNHPVTKFEVIETHISWVLLTGDYAYKIKKPVNFGFLDFSTLARRRHFCQQELQLNRRLAPQIYLEVVAISGTPEHPSLDHNGEAIEYAIKMRQFAQQAQLDRVLAAGRLTPRHIDQLAERIAAFHAQAQIASSDSQWGDPATIRHPVEENFAQIRPLLSQADDLAALARLERWSLQQLEQLTPLMQQRKRDGFIRNGHGDMHLANIALIDEEIVIFDCIEFNDAFRWIDVISDIAFTAMDLDDRSQPQLAARLINTYLQRSGDYQGLALYNFYRLYRALVRAKVACLRLTQPGLTTEQKRSIQQQYRDYITLAQRYCAPAHPLLCITHGLSGSGKTTLSQPLLERFGMIRIRSDVERKRLYGYRAEARTDASIYNQTANQATYERLARLSRAIISSGRSVIVDATFLKQAERAQYRALAHSLGVPFVILHFHAPKAQLIEWIEERQRAGMDASEATTEILEKQLRWEEPLEAQEADALIEIDSRDDKAADQLIAKVRRVLEEQMPPSQ